MLNPENVDYSENDKNLIEIEFTDEHGNKNICIHLTRSDAHRLAKMIMQKTRYNRFAPYIKNSLMKNTGEIYGF